ncbi:MAG: prepilin peptidase [Croceibacterium sp.]
MTEFAGPILLLAWAAIGGWLDVAQRRLPNWLCLATWISGVAVLALTSGFPVVWWGLAHSVVALVVGMVLFRFGWIGGGDAKFYAACAAWFPLQQGFTLLMLVSAAGLALVAGWIVTRRARSGQKAARGDFAKVPYGLAIALGAIAAKVIQL